MTTTVGLIAGREITTRLRSRVLRIATVVMIAIVIGIALVAKVSAGIPSDESVGVREVQDGQLDAVLIEDAGAIRVVVKSALDDGLQSVLTLVAQRAALDRQVSASAATRPRSARRSPRPR